MAERRSLSKSTIALAIYIIASASFMLQFRNFLIDAFGEDAVKQAFFYFAFLIVGFYMGYTSFKKLPVYRIIFILVLFGLAYILILRQPYFAEKLHVVEYGILGHLALKDLSRVKAGKWWVNVIYTLCFVALIGSLDEAFQWILPYRVFDLRDIATNIVSGFLGTMVGYFIIY